MKRSLLKYILVVCLVFIAVSSVVRTKTGFDIGSQKRGFDIGNKTIVKIALEARTDEMPAMEEDAVQSTEEEEVEDAGWIEVAEEPAEEGTDKSVEAQTHEMPAMEEDLVQSTYKKEELEPPIEKEIIIVQAPAEETAPEELVEVEEAELEQTIEDVESEEERISSQPPAEQAAPEELVEVEEEELEHAIEDVESDEESIIAPAPVKETAPEEVVDVESDEESIIAPAPVKETAPEEVVEVEVEEEELEQPMEDVESKEESIIAPAAVKETAPKELVEVEEEELDQPIEYVSPAPVEETAPEELVEAEEEELEQPIEDIESVEESIIAPAPVEDTAPEELMEVLDSSAKLLLEPTPITSTLTTADTLTAPVVMVPNSNDFETCRAHNVVRRRGDGNELIEGNETRPFSLRQQDFVAANEIQPICETLQQSLNAIKYGQRKWDNENLKEELKFLYPSTFVPYQCQIPPQNADQLCEIMSLFDSILLVGDSISRHVQGGLITILKNDFVIGFIKGKGSEAEEACQCDGQFSEYLPCRSWNKDFYDPPIQQVCPHLNPSSLEPIVKERFVALYYAFEFGRLDFGWFQHCAQVKPDGTPSSSKGALLVLQGGLHYKLDPDEYRVNILEPILKHDLVQQCAQNQRLYIIWQSHGRQAPLMDSLYPHQSANHSESFNANMEKWLHQFSNHTIASVDWMAMTNGAQTSDGVHYLTNVNYFKAQYLMHIAKLLKKENQYAVLMK